MIIRLTKVYNEITRKIDKLFQIDVFTEDLNISHSFAITKLRRSEAVDEGSAEETYDACLVKDLKEEEDGTKLD